MNRVSPDTVHLSGTGLQRPRPPWTRPLCEPLEEASLVEAALCLHDQALELGRSSPKGRHLRRPSAVVVLAGTRELLLQADGTRIRLAAAPNRSNDWRSLTTVPTHLGRDLTVEVVAAPRGIKVPVALDPPVGASAAEAMRARALKQMGLTDRAQSGRSEPKPGRLVTVATGSYCDENGTLYPGAVLELVQSTERLIDLGGVFAPCPHLRRLHVFEAVTPGEVLTVATDLSRGVFPAPSSQSLRTCLRRLADGQIIAFSETVLR